MLDLPLAKFCALTPSTHALTSFGGEISNAFYPEPVEGQGATPTKRGSIAPMTISSFSLAANSFTKGRELYYFPSSSAPSRSLDKSCFVSSIFRFAFLKASLSCEILPWMNSSLKGRLLIGIAPCSDSGNIKNS